MQLAVARYLAIVLLALVGCRMGCLAPPAEQIDSPVADSLNATVSAGAAAIATAAFDHSSYGELLKRHVVPSTGRVDYAGLKKDEAVLDRYIERLGDVNLEALSRDSQKALLINAYNAFTLKLILENYPGIDSIKDLDSPWKTKRWKLAGDVLSLDDIEHGLLRPTFEDPRIHFAVNCASIGCPPLADFAYGGAMLDEQLDRVTRQTLRHPRYAKAEGGELRLTKILSWYGDDFTKEKWEPRAESIPQFVARYAGPDVASLVDEHGAKTPVSFLDYDWSLNDSR